VERKSLGRLTVRVCVCVRVRELPPLNDVETSGVDHWRVDMLIRVQSVIYSIWGRDFKDGDSPLRIRVKDLRLWGEPIMR